MCSEQLSAPDLARSLRTQRVADAGIVEQRLQPRSREGPAGDDVFEYAEHAGLLAQTLALHFEVLIGGGDVGVTEQRGHPSSNPFSSTNGTCLLWTVSRLPVRTIASM